MNNDMEAITIRPQNNEQLEAIKSVLKALKIPFEKEDSYNPEFVKKIKNAEEDTEETISLKSNKEIEEYFKRLEADVQG